MKCPVCEEVKKFIEDRLFQLRRRPEMSAEKHSLAYIYSIIHKLNEEEESNAHTRM